jgi:surface antigen
MRTGKRVSMVRGGTMACAFAAAALVTSQASAQFGGFSIPSIPRSSSSAKTDSDGCPKGRSKSAGSSMLGTMLGRQLGQAASSAGLSRFLPSADVADTLTNAIACRLDPEEQKQAAQATVEATRGEKVGSTVTWTSNTREDVSGTSTVIARNDEPTSAGQPGRKCIMVSDVIIVNGEETTANKRMCRAPGSARYSLDA